MNIRTPAAIPQHRFHQESRSSLGFCVFPFAVAHKPSIFACRENYKQINPEVLKLLLKCANDQNSFPRILTVFIANNTEETITSWVDESCKVLVSLLILTMQVAVNFLTPTLIQLACPPTKFINERKLRSVIGKNYFDEIDCLQVF